jgi:hypothetical protein
LATIIVAAVLVAGAVALFAGGGPDPAQFEHLKQPQVRTMADQKVLVVETQGDPTVVGGEAFNLLFKTYFKLKGVPKSPRNLAPRARWPLSLDTPKDQWIGRYAMPVPESIIVGEHEEEYVRGPGMFSRGDPEKYLTIIRYRVKKAQ